jgi:hypothetical protein
LIICFDLRLGARRKPTATMGLSKTNRIIILLVIDTAFFLLELITGMDYLTPSGAAIGFADFDFLQAMPSTPSPWLPIPFTWYVPCADLDSLRLSRHRLTYA